jgi:hypothetical protein
VSPGTIPGGITEGTIDGGMSHPQMMDLLNGFTFDQSATDVIAGWENSAQQDLQRVFNYEPQVVAVDIIGGPMSFFALSPLGTLSGHIGPDGYYSWYVSHTTTAQNCLAVRKCGYVSMVRLFVLGQKSFQVEVEGRIIQELMPGEIQ